MRKALLTLTALTFTTGCNALGTGGPLEGVWMFEAPSPDANCDTRWSTNMRDASLGGSNASDWTTIDEHEQSLDIFFARISHGRSDDAVMILGDEVIPGSRVDKDTWEFAYVATLHDVEGREHDNGYRFTETTEREVNTVYTLTREGNRWLSGDANFDSLDVERWEERDRWNGDVTGQYAGDIPAWNVGAPDNYSDTNDCLDQLCFIETETHCDNNVGLVGTWTGLDGEGEFELENNFTSASSPQDGTSL